MSRWDADEADGPMAFTHFVSSIYRMAPDNPFNLPLPFFRRWAAPQRTPPSPVVRLEDRPAAEAMAIVLFYQFLHR